MEWKELNGAGGQACLRLRASFSPAHPGRAKTRPFPNEHSIHLLTRPGGVADPNCARRLFFSAGGVVGVEPIARIERARILHFPKR